MEDGPGWAGFKPTVFAAIHDPVRIGDPELAAALDARDSEPPWS
ncbi:MAG: hypothetical protein QOF73_779 [Thermomicrobiales bacterium]|jgi:hypothetical protein|nr:hypothetical protein [Thermomicrobiales bacterium]